MFRTIFHILQTHCSYIIIIVFFLFVLFVFFFLFSPFFHSYYFRLKCWYVSTCVMWYISTNAIYDRQQQQLHARQYSCRLVSSTKRTPYHMIDTHMVCVDKNGKERTEIVRGKIESKTNRTKKQNHNRKVRKYTLCSAAIVTVYVYASNEWNSSEKSRRRKNRVHVPTM